MSSNQPMAFTIESQHITDPQDNNAESMCGQPVDGRETTNVLDLNEPTCESCLRILADRIADARVVHQMAEESD